MVKLKSFIEKLDKYIFIIIAGKKIIILSSDDSKTEAKKKAYNKIKNKLDKLEGAKIYCISTRVVSPSKIKKDKTAKIPMIGGPIVSIVSTYRIKNKTLTSTKTVTNVYFTKNFLHKNKEISVKEIKKIVYAEHKDKTRGVGRINTIENI